MAKEWMSGHLVSEYNHIPSGRMVIRRYQDLEERYIRNYFKRGLYCNHLTKFEDDNEGLIGEPGYSGAQRGALAVASSRGRKRNEEDLVSDEEFEDSLRDFHQIVRNKHFANCWRLGMDEPMEMWDEYIEDDELKAGVAFETTVRQFVRAIPRKPALSNFQDSPDEETPIWNVHVGAQGSDIRVDAVRYQDREKEGTLQPAGYQAAVNFFKRKNYDYEKEFRLLINPFDSARMLRANPDGTIVAEMPEIRESHRFFPMATVWMTNQIVLAPNAGKDQRNKLEQILDDIGVTYGSGEGSDVEIVPSSCNLSSRSETHDYDAVFAGQDNYQGTMEYLNNEHQEMLEQSQQEDWPVTDLVLLMMKRGGAVVEGYRYSTDEPGVDLSEYGHDEFQGVCVTRNGESSKYPIEYKNDRMKEFEQ
jgi:hypothetical protein